MTTEVTNVIVEVLPRFEGYVYPNEGTAHPLWGFLIVLYPYITGLVAGAFIMASLVRVFKVKALEPVYRLSLLTALAFLLCATLPLLFHLGHPERCFEIMMTPHLTSPMAIFGFVYAWYLMAVLLLELWFDYRQDLVEWSKTTPGWKGIIYRLFTVGVTDESPKAVALDMKMGRILSVVGIPSAFLLHGYVGFIFGSVKANPWWGNSIMPIIFILSAIVSGIALCVFNYMVLTWIRRHTVDMRCLDTMAMFLFYALVVDASIEGLDWIHRVYAAEEGFSVMQTMIREKLFYTLNLGHFRTLFAPLHKLLQKDIAARHGGRGMQATGVLINGEGGQGPGTSQFELVPMDTSNAVPWLQAIAMRSSWWAISILLHALVILLASLLSMAIELPDEDAGVIMVTELATPVHLDQQTEAIKLDAADALKSKHETPATDPTSKESSDIVIPPEILEKAELGDHFETVNPDRPDTQSAFGNPDAHVFHTVKGDDSAAGGGGTSGAGALDDLIGIGGAGSAGTGGGWGGGNGTGIGTDNGAGHGSFGNRNGGGRKLMVKRHGGSAATEGAVETALDWLARHQEADGSWSVRKTEGEGDWDPGVTGMATLAFLGAGHTEKVGKYKENVRKAVAWIISTQRADGALGSDPKFHEHHGGFGYHHAICGLALAEAAGMANIPSTKEAAQKALDYSCNVHQAGEGSDKLGWRYQPRSPGDMSVSGWYIMQLKSAKIAGLHVDAMSFDGAIHFLDNCQADPKNVKIEDAAYDDGKHRYGYTGPGVMVNTTAIGILCRLFMGWKPDEFNGAALWLLRTNLPEWRADLGPANGGGWPMYYMYYATLTMFQLGGDHWKTWNEALKKTLVDNQRKDGDARGSWDAISMWEKKIGRTYTTALGALSLEVYYRYQQLKH